MAGTEKKKDIKSWFMKNIILPNNEEIDKPGFVISKYVGNKKSGCYVREVFFPEKIISEIEKRAAAKFGSEGRRALYAAGKLWGLRYASTTNLPAKSSMSKADFLGFMDSFMKFMESEYATKIGYEVDYDADIFTSTYENLMSCSQGGNGFFLTGTMNGAWQHICGRQTEGVHEHSKSPGKAKCKIVCAPAPRLPQGSEIFEVRASDSLGIEPEYFTLNRVKKAQYARNSMLNLLQAGMFKYEGGFFQCGRERFMLNEASSVYFLETVLGRMDGGAELLFDAARDFFTGFEAVGKGAVSLAGDFLPAQGWGDIFVNTKEKKAYVRSYPWTGYSRETSFPILRGMLSGLTARVSGKDILFSGSKAFTTQDSLDMVMSAD